MTWLEAFFGKLEQVGTYILWKFKTINVRRLNIVQLRPLLEFFFEKVKFRAFADQRHRQEYEKYSTW